jgi:hypothetical protein
MGAIRAIGWVESEKVEICREIWEVLEQFRHDKSTMVLQGTNAGFIGTIITAANGQQIVRQYLVKFVPEYRRNGR